jgi:pyrroline-5-carboxylate reductase
MPENIMKLCLIGCGKMGHAMLTGWLGLEDIQAEISVIDPAHDMAQALFSTPSVGLRYYHSVAELPAGYCADIAILAVKPQIMDNVLPQVAAIGDSATGWISIAAGISTTGLGQHLGVDARLMRAMPNTPAAIGRGVTALYCTETVSAAQKERAEALLQACGDVVHIDDELMMDAVTAVSGSGPAYVFLLAEVMATAGRKLGLPADVADRLARQTVAGSGALLAVETAPASQLRVNVTSEGGTTAAALGVLMAEGGMSALFDTALEAAAFRAQELDRSRR